jgi:hypothetical protein
MFIFIIFVDSRPWCCGFASCTIFLRLPIIVPLGLFVRIINIILCMQLASYTCTNLVVKKIISHTITERICKEDICGWTGEHYTIPKDKIRPMNFIIYVTPGKIILWVFACYKPCRRMRKTDNVSIKGQQHFSSRYESRWESQFVSIEYKEAWVKLSWGKGNFMPLAPLYLFSRLLTLELVGHLT